MKPSKLTILMLIASAFAMTALFGCSPSTPKEGKTEGKVETPSATEDPTATEAKLYDKSQDEAYAMGLEAWEKLAEANNGTKESVDYNKTLTFFLQGGIAALKKMTDASDNQQAFFSATESAVALSEAMKAAGAKAYGIEDVPETDHLYRQIELVKVMEVVVSKGKMTEMLVTGNQFREIYDGYSEQIKAEAAKTKADVAEEIKSVIAAADAAREAGSILGEGESMMISQLAAHWLAPSSYDSPVPVESKS